MIKDRILRVALTLAAVPLFGSCEYKSPDSAGQPAAASSPAAVTAESGATDSSDSLLPNGPTDADYPHLHNLLQLTQRIYTGGEPKGDEAFAELGQLGVRTVVSVDGARPDVEMAERHGMTYVHIPVGYDGISDKAGKSLAQLVRTASGPFYIHCHHGNHRGPAAAAVACIADGAADGTTALAILEKAGTSRGYAGLWRDVADYRPPDDAEELPELVAVAEVGSLAAAMAHIDRASDDLKLCEAAQWKTPDDHPDLTPSQVALLLKEAFRETARQLQAENDYDERFLEWMHEAEKAAQQLESDLTSGNSSRASAALVAIHQRCKQCHQEYRN